MPQLRLGTCLQVPLKTLLNIDMKTANEAPSKTGTYDLTAHLRKKLATLPEHQLDALDKLREPTLEECRKELISRMEVCVDSIECDPDYAHVWCWEFRAMFKALNLLSPPTA
jgi:hypothetical protein